MERGEGGGNERVGEWTRRPPRLEGAQARQAVAGMRPPHGARRLPLFGHDTDLSRLNPIQLG